MSVRKLSRLVSKVETKNYTKLIDYFLNKHDILKQTKKSASTPNNKIVAPIAQYITNTATGYFLGKPVVYASKDTELVEKINKIFEYNDEQDHNFELGKLNSVYGSCVEMLYLDEDSKIRFTKLNPDDVIFIYESDYNSPLAVIRKIESESILGTKIRLVEF